MSTASVGVVGGVNVDLVVRCARLPAPGETVLGGHLQRFTGGKGANQAAAAARLGAPTSLVGCVGDDSDGEWLLASVAAHGVDVTHVRRSPRASGAALIAVDEGGENLIVVAPGANEDLSVTDVAVEEFDVVLTQLETSLAVLDELSRRSRHLILNTAPSRPVDADVLARCAVVIANEHEAATLDIATIDACVITRGALGAQYWERGVLRASREAPRIDVVDTVGAGDVFCGAYAWRFACGDAPADALAYAVVAGALATLAPGAQGSLPTDNEVRSWLARA